MTAQAAARDPLLAARRELVRATFDEAVAHLGSNRQPPALRIERGKRGSWRGRYDERSNTVHICETGFVADPAVPADALRFVVAHEVGHWSDPDLTRQSRRAILCMLPPVVAFAAALIVLIASVLPDPGAPPPWFGFTIAGVAALALVCLVPFAYFKHPTEFYADAAAARVVGRDAALRSMRAETNSRFPSYTHPRWSTRIARVEQLSVSERRRAVDGSGAADCAGE
ncbi:M48 family metalloprotease [Williamsia serinedens]|uniref:Peptidase family M48 n=1 Tax=Williamsia serinedens TaxID=391736 RepID=A0ABT1H746_9NOCA|nr:M48 family metalloprotease [Williamsia serinedens]MCP2163056.1 Peptidase family M48 [Williamsia serinedens]